MLNKMCVDKKELSVFEIDQDKLDIVKDFQDFQFYKRLTLLQKNKISLYAAYFDSNYKDRTNPVGWVSMVTNQFFPLMSFEDLV
jgi:hypothetical protein